LAGLDPEKVIGKPAEQMGRLAPRLNYSVMEMEALKQAGFALPRNWEEALAEYIRALDQLQNPLVPGAMPTAKSW